METVIKTQEHLVKDSRPDEIWYDCTAGYFYKNSLSTKLP